MNTETKAVHSPGPWKVATKAVPANINGWKRSFISIGSLVKASEMTALVPAGHGENGEANARLIAAAPELLEACLAAYDALDNVYDVDAPTPGHYKEHPFSGAGAVLSRLIRAIKKAEGRDQ